MVMGVMLGLMAGLVRGDDLVITSFSRNGEVTWTYPTNGVREYRVEWCSDLTAGLWCDLEGGLRGIAPSGGTMSVSVPLNYRIKAFGPEPTNMVYIPAGWFDMGNCMNANDGYSDELPVHGVYVSGFYMDQYAVSSNLWDEVRTYALANGYEFDNSGEAKATEHPVHTLNWYDCVKWANARSQREGLTPCYYVDAGHTVIYKSGNHDLTAENVDWTANGYRLPTEAEWEKAARGAVSGHRFPWADDTISHGRANYQGDSNSYAYDISAQNGHHPDYNNNPQPYTSPVGAFTANGYGLYDMAGNVYEWCWDRYGSTYYSSSPGTNPRGPESGSSRVRRGGIWNSVAFLCRVADRHGLSPAIESYLLGFRLVRATQ